jgi:hypothetical protein
VKIGEGKRRDGGLGEDAMQVVGRKKKGEEGGKDTRGADHLEMQRAVGEAGEINDQHKNDIPYRVEE